MKGKKFLNMFILDVENYIKSSLRKIGVSYKLQPSLLKQELEHDEVYEDSWEEKDEWLAHVKNDVMSTAFC